MMMKTKENEMVKERRLLVQRSDSLGNLREAVMEYRSDYLGRMEEIVYPDGEKVIYGYNYGGEVVSVRGEKQGTTFPYVDKIGYDEWGQRVYIKLGNGVETTYQYDENRRWLKEIETVSQKGYGTPVLQNIKYSFDSVGNVSGYTNTAGSYTTAQQYEYDNLYQLTNVKGQTENRQFGLIDYTASYEQTYSFDNAGLGNMMNKNSSSIQSDSRLLGDDLNYKLDYEYATGYAHRVNRIGTRYYQYDGNGNLTAEQEGAFSSGTGNGGTPTSGGYTITDLGDDVSVIDQGWGMVNTPSNGGGGTPGNPTTRGYRRDYQWNERNLLKVSSDNRYTVQYTYGADGERTSKYSTSATGSSPTETLYFNKMWSWRHDGLLSDRTGRNSKHIYVGETRMVTKIGRADGSFTNEEKLKQYWYHSDHLGSAQLISNVDGEEYERIEYTPYGELWIEKASAATNIDIPYRFTGKERDDETGLYYYGARYLDPKYSRWLSTDPALKDYIPSAPIDDKAKKRNNELPGMGGVYNTVNLHLYHYAGNNPVKYTDPNGEFTNYNPFDAFGQMLQISSKPLDKLTGMFFSVLGGNKAAEQQLANMSQRLVNSMAEVAGNALITGMEFMSDNGSYLAIASYASGNIVIGAVIDGITVASDVTLAFNEYNETGDKAGLITSLAGIIATNAIGSGVGKAAVADGGLAKAELMKTLEPIISDLVSTAISALVKITAPEN
jgi:RHS repeat-associated protein